MILESEGDAELSICKLLGLTARNSMMVRTLCLGSMRLNIGAFFSMSGMTMNLWWPQLLTSEAREPRFEENCTTKVRRA